MSELAVMLIVALMTLSGVHMAEDVQQLSNCTPLEITNAHFEEIEIDFNVELFAGGLTFPGFKITCDEGYLINTGSKLQKSFRTGCLFGQWMPPFSKQCEKIPTTTAATTTIALLNTKMVPTETTINLSTPTISIAESTAGPTTEPTTLSTVEPSPTTTTPATTTPIPTEYCGFDTGDECGWLQIVTEREREVAIFTVSSGPSADYMPGARPKGTAGGHESTNYVVLKAAHYPKDFTANIKILPMKGSFTRCLRMKYCLSSGGKLKVLISNQGSVWESMQTPAGYQDAAIELTNIGSRTTVSLSAIRGGSAAGDIVIDSIEYTLGGCN